MEQMILKNGRPDITEGREAREVRTYELLDQLGIPYERVDHAPAETMELCREIDAVLGAPICKNLFLCNRQGTVFYLLMMPGDKPFKTKELSAQIGSARLSFASPEKMLEYLDIRPGAVSVMGLMNDSEREVSLLIDEDLLECPAFGCHPCVNTSSLRISIDDLLHRFLPAVKHGYRTVHLTGSDE
jgi:Ala-tRNA(Pro) deacylase